jgi:hypothetical protein
MPSRMPRPRFQLRQVMGAVAVSGAILGVYLDAARWPARSRAYRARAAEFASIWKVSDPFAMFPAAFPADQVAKHRIWLVRRRHWASEMEQKYLQAAKRPWLPPWPDPPEPR